MNMHVKFLIPFILMLSKILCFGLESEREGSEVNLSQTGISLRINVDKEGYGDFTTLQAAIDAIPPNNSKWIHVYVAPGIYREKIIIPKDKPFVYIEGSGMDVTKIVWDDHNGTSRSATFTVRANDFIARHICVMNVHNHPLGHEMDMNSMKQAVAALIQGDRNAFYNVGFYSVQDTLYDREGRHLFKWCHIEGNTDFIFGAGQSIYQNCSINIIPIPGSPKLAGYITAQSRDSPISSSAFVFDQCNVTGSARAYLGRAWRAYSRVIFSNSFFADVIVPKGWDAWGFLGGKENGLTYVEYECRGPGADTSKRVTWMKKMDETTVDKLISLSFIDDGWIEQQPH